MAEITPGQVYDIIGSAGFEKLVAGFYRRVATDDVLRPMYPEDDLEPAQRRLQLFLEQFFGGPTTYSQERGHPRLRMRHAPFKIDQAARNRWVELMTAALDEVGLDPEVAAVMRDYFENGASFLINAQ
ncbi:MAG: globin [Chloroflexi bacterium]|nr:globin [Chloroflexota bacterium]